MKKNAIKRVFILAAFAFPSGLFAVDTDNDGLDDSVETNTGVYVSPTNTGTDPNNPDTDGDGAGDWYEVVTIETHPANPQPNAPNSSSIKPIIPYPLPAPGTTSPATNKPVKVYILSGQSNMVGQGNMDPLGTPGTLATITRNEHKFTNLLNGAGWAVRNDVMYRGVIAAVAKAPLTAGQGASATAIGPELGFGQVLGYVHEEPVLIIKSSQGGRALGWDFLPPGSVQYTVGSTTYAGYGDSPASWATGTTPVPTGFYGGYQYDQCFLRKADWAPAGSTNAAVFNVTDVLDHFDTEYPEYAAQGFEIAGFAWFQGWNDGLSFTSFYANRYETNMVQFIKQIRTYYESRYPGKIKPKAPFVIATCAFEGWSETYLNQYPTRRTVINAQLAVSDPAKYPEFAGNVKTMEARGYWRDSSVSPANAGYHYNRNAETFMLVGDALGRGMVELLGGIAPDTTPPTPNPMTFAVPPVSLGTNAIILTATAASDPSGPVQYYFTNTTSHAVSGWLPGTVWTNAGLAAGQSYGYRVRARDAVSNVTDWSTIVLASTASGVVSNPVIRTALAEDFEHEWADNARVTTTNGWVSGPADRSIVTNLTEGYTGYAGRNIFPLAYPHRPDNRVLSLDTQGETLKVGFTEMAFTNAPVYVDMMVNLPVNPSLPSPVLNSNNPKTSLFLAAEGSATNLYVLHGQKAAEGFGMPAFTPISNIFEPGTWHRVTFLFDATSENGGAEAFSLLLDGQAVTSPDAYGDNWKTQIFEDPVPDGGAWFLSAARYDGSTATNLASVNALGFLGNTGLCDDLVVTFDRPDFSLGTVLLLAFCEPWGGGQGAVLKKF